ncbi:MAG: histone deacetylase [Clostridia bacterium]|nr:histone deacetylase [Clostridia bacterium]
MKLLFNRTFLDHNIGSAYEGSYRLRDFADLESRYASGEEFLTLVHPQSYIDTIKDYCETGAAFAEVKLAPVSYQAACLAVGLAIEASQNGDFAVIRPPGHHASQSKASGFCLFNNVAIASQKLVGEGKKVFILDIDGHHGDGTQNIFYESNKVLYCSIHQQNSYPYTGTFMEIGAGAGLGFTLNIPIPENSGEKEFFKALQKAIDAGSRFEPDVVAISAGFDGYRKDKLLNMNFSLHAYYECGYKLSKAFKNVFAVLEGGYHDDLRQCVDMFTEGINIGAKPSAIKWNDDMSIG